MRKKTSKVEGARKLMRRSAVLLAGVVIFVIGFTCGSRRTALQDFRWFSLGFDRGVRYGLVAYIEDPTENDVPTITARARWWLVRIERQPPELEK